MKYLIILLSIFSYLKQSKCDYTNILWSDEFNDNSLNLEKWKYETGPSNSNNELQTYTDKNTYINNGILNINIKKEELDGRHYSSSRIVTNEVFLYGKIEARLKIPKGSGIWPGFWLLADGNGWPKNGEIDILEATNNMDHIVATVHYETNNNHEQSGCTFSKLPDFSTDFHTYGIERDENEIRWYFDNELFCTEKSYLNYNLFHNKMNIILNVAVGGNMPGNNIDESAFPQSMQIDYVRVYSYTAPTPVNCDVNCTLPTNTIEKCYTGACPSGNDNDCKLNEKGRIWCTNCPAYAKNWLRCGGTEDPDHQCDSNAGCANGSLCQVNSENKVWCLNCPEGYSGDRCEIKPKQRYLRGSKRFL